METKFNVKQRVFWFEGTHYATGPVSSIVITEGLITYAVYGTDYRESRLFASKHEVWTALAEDLEAKAHEARGRAAAALAEELEL